MSSKKAPLPPFVPDYQGHLLAGVDEVGRGPLIGAVVACAVILDPAKPIAGLNDSKKLTEKKRSLLAEEIKEKALAWSIGRAEAAEIDQLNIYHATHLAMTRAVDGLSMGPEHVLVDGNRCPKWDYSSEAVVKGDSRHPAISAASIIAKVYRDDEMVELEREFPGFGLAGHKGYPTKVHLDAIKTLGVTTHHRRSFRPVAEALASCGEYVASDQVSEEQLTLNLDDSAGDE